ncbi:hypothetical protein HX776_08790 [Pseudomonas agarici]|uniref:inhibitor of vertebrate lysozyme family protein n=1 Tax=Pseudomonas agarici TaxID=46677 RepID=UPI0002DD2BFF|nr:inhibitor of vertebrate lysozyme family protein [Pseudomonas agarici]NWC08912.1 hypothetical protein [Pseudomonas agarici]SEK61154.1 Inhibitor of vertebrate lysozyme (Ivy) [Pseudomonas agarici]
MSVPALKVLVAGLMVGGAGWALAANDGQARVNELLSASPEYRQAWRDVVGKEERLPEWVINLSGSAEQMNAVEEDGDKYLVGPLCETVDSCLNKRLIVAVSLDKEDAYGMLVDWSAGLPVDYRFLGQPDAGMQALLKEQLRKDPNGH